jgi:hypothetical protein
LADLCGFAWPASRSARLRSISLALARDPRRAHTLMSLRALSTVELRLSAAEHRRWRHAKWPAAGKPLFDGHWAQAVIETSLEEREYLAGHHRQAVRTNIHRARDLGIAATRLGGYNEFIAASTPVYESREGGDAVLAEMQSGPPADGFAWYSASTPAHESPVIVAAVALFGNFGVLAVMVGNRNYRHVGYARYLLHTFILGDLAAHGVEHLLVGSVLRESGGNQYFQRLLGYRVCNLRPTLLTDSGSRQGHIATTLRGLLMSDPAARRPCRPPYGDLRAATSTAPARRYDIELSATETSSDPSTPRVAAIAGKGRQTAGRAYIESPEGP